MPLDGLEQVGRIVDGNLGVSGHCLCVLLTCRDKLLGLGIPIYPGIRWDFDAGGESES